MIIDTVHLGQAISNLRTLPGNSCDLILLDVPYGMTELWWDIRPDFTELWPELLRVARDEHTPMIFTGTQPFTSILICSNLPMFRCEWIWDKSVSTGYLNSKIAPLKCHEHIIVFSQAKANYFPLIGENERKRKFRNVSGGDLYGKHTRVSADYDTTRYPTSILDFPHQPMKTERATQKPLDLMAYLIATYSRTDDVVLDCYCGTGTTLVAALNLQRHFYACDIDPDAVQISKRRLKAAYQRE